MCMTLEELSRSLNVYDRSQLASRVRSMYAKIIALSDERDALRAALDGANIENTQLRGKLNARSAALVEALRLTERTADQLAVELSFFPPGMPDTRLCATDEDAAADESMSYWDNDDYWDNDE